MLNNLSISSELTSVLGYQHLSLFYFNTLSPMEPKKYPFRSQLHSSASIAAELRFIYTSDCIESGAVTN